MIILDQIKGQLPALQTMLKEAGESLDPAGPQAELSKIEEQITVPNFWDDQENAQKIMKEKKSLENSLDEFNGLKARLEDLEVMIEMAEEAEGSGEAGVVLRADAKGGLIVACADGAVELVEIQAPNAKRMEARAYLLGKRITVGERLNI